MESINDNIKTLTLEIGLPGIRRNFELLLDEFKDKDRHYDQFLYKLFARFGIFIIWEIVLLIIGFSVIYKFSKGKSASAVIALWLIWIVVSILLGNLVPGMA
jgi:hypothetical protein